MYSLFIIFSSLVMPQEEAIYARVESVKLSPVGKVFVRYEESLSSSPNQYHSGRSRLKATRGAVLYCGYWDYCYWLLKERSDVQSEIGLSNLQLNKIEKLSDDINEHRKIIRKSAHQPDREKKQQSIDEASKEIESAISKLLSARQKKRLLQLAFQIELARYGEDFIKAFQEIVTEVGDESAINLSWEGLAKSVSKAETSRSEFELMNKLLAEILPAEKLSAFQTRARKFGFDLHPDFQAYSLLDCEKLASQLDGTENLAELWGWSSRLRLSALAVRSYDVRKIDSGEKSLRLALTMDQSLIRYLELTADQIADVNFGLFSKSQVIRPLEKSLLPFQMELIEERGMWREIEVFGFVASIAKGRAKDFLGLDSATARMLLEKSAELASELESERRQEFETRLSLVKQAFAEAGEDKLYVKYFGAPSKSLVFER